MSESVRSALKVTTSKGSVTVAREAIEQVFGQALAARQPLRRTVKEAIGQRA